MCFCVFCVVLSLLLSIHFFLFSFFLFFCFSCKDIRRPNVRIPKKSDDYEEKRDRVFTYPGANFNQSNTNNAPSIPKDKEKTPNKDKDKDKDKDKEKNDSKPDVISLLSPEMKPISGTNENDSNLGPIPAFGSLEDELDDNRNNTNNNDSNNDNDNDIINNDDNETFQINDNWDYDVNNDYSSFNYDYDDYNFAQTYYTHYDDTDENKNENSNTNDNSIHHKRKWSAEFAKAFDTGDDDANNGNDNDNDIDNDNDNGNDDLSPPPAKKPRRMLVRPNKPKITKPVQLTPVRQPRIRPPVKPKSKSKSKSTSPSESPQPQRTIQESPQPQPTSQPKPQAVVVGQQQSLHAETFVQQRLEPEETKVNENCETDEISDKIHNLEAPSKPPKPHKPPKPPKPQKPSSLVSTGESSMVNDVKSDEISNNERNESMIGKNINNVSRNWTRNEKINLLYLCYNVLLTKGIDYTFYIPNMNQNGMNDDASDNISDTNIEKYNQLMQNLNDDDWDDIELYFDQCTIDHLKQLLKDLFTMDRNLNLHNAAIIRLLRQNGKLNYAKYTVDGDGDGDSNEDFLKCIRKFTRLTLNFQDMMKDKDGVYHQLSPSYCELENEFVQSIVRFLLKLPIERLHCCTVHNIKQAFVINRHKTIQDYITIRMGEVLRRMKTCDIIVIFDAISEDNIRKCVQLRYTFVQQFVKFFAKQNHKT